MLSRIFHNRVKRIIVKKLYVQIRIKLFIGLDLDIGIFQVKIKEILIKIILFNRVGNTF